MAIPDIHVDTLLATLPLFNELDAEEIRRIALGTHLIRAPRETTLFQRGDPCHGFYVVVHGQVKLAFTSPQGSEKVVEIIGRGSSFGEALMFMEKPYIVYAQTLVDSMLLHVNQQVVFEELERDAQFARKMLAGLSRRLHGLISDVEAYSLRSGTQRVIGFLMQYSDGSADADGRIKVQLPASKGTIASRLNLTQETFSRILHDLGRKGLISINGKVVHILDDEKLRTYEG